MPAVHVLRGGYHNHFVLPLPDLTNGTLAEVVPQFGNDTLNLTGITSHRLLARASSPRDVDTAARLRERRHTW